jgi:hypothetical protein
MLNIELDHLACKPSGDIASCVHHGRAALILKRIGKGSRETHGKRPRI